MNIFILVLLGFSTFLNTLVPISGTATITPLIASLTDVHTAIGLVGFYFFMSAVVRLGMFFRDIQWPLVKKLLPISAVGSVFGTLALVGIPDVFLLIVVAVFTVYFMQKKIFGRSVEGKKSVSSRLGALFIGLLSGFLQGSGLAGSDLRNGYLYASGLSIVQVHGTTALVGGMNFALATLIRLSLGTVSFPDVALLLTIFPFVVVGTLLGKRVMLKIKKAHETWIVILVMAIGLVLVLQKIVSLLSSGG